MDNAARSRMLTSGTVSLLYFLLMAGTFNSLGAILPRMVADLQMNWGQAGFGFTLLGLACGLASMLPAISIRRIGVSATFAAGSALLISGFVCLALTQSVLMYHVGATLLGLGFCFAGTVPGVHVISKIYENPSKLLGAYFMAGGLGSVFGPLFFYGINHVWGNWRLFWWVCAAATTFVGAMTCAVTNIPLKPRLFQNDTAVDAVFGGVASRAAMVRPQFWMIVLAYTVCILDNTTLHSFSVQHLGEHGLTLDRATTLLSAVALVSAVASSGAGILGARVDARLLTMFSLGSLAVACFALTVQQSPFVLFVFVLSMGLGIGSSYVSTVMMLLDYFGTRANLELYSIMCLISTSAAAGPVLGGVIRDRMGTFSSVFMFLGCLSVVWAVLVMFTRKPRGEPQKG